MEFAGTSSRFPLHLACIGEPPATVRALAQRAGARISIHESLTKQLGVFANKLRGFEAPIETGRLLLLDVDIIILGDLSGLADLVPFDAISAAHSHSAIILPQMWEELYARLDLPLPARSMTDFHVALHDDPITPEQGGLYPSYSSGAVLAPKSADLHRLWLEHLGILAEYRDRWMTQLRPLNMLVGDEPALATAMRTLELRGQKIVMMPDPYHGKWRHLYRREPRLQEFALFHMSSSFAVGDTLAEKIDPKNLFYPNKLFRRYTKRWLEHSKSHVREAVKYYLPASFELLQLRSTMKKLYDHHIREVVS